ncbi:MAG: hypothetical protein QOG68_1435 [Solirubrobacteraceae bacterium]|jgi:two-component system response regulator DesR|nr:hypothetical protein [Solirubrobacteraceae bacterium]
MLTAVSAVQPVPFESRRTNVRVLVVHEEEVVQCGWRLLLSRQPWVARCVAARGADDAIGLTRRYRPDVAILDLELGHEQVASIGADLVAECPDLKLLLLAGRTTISPKAARFLGATGVVSKTRPAAELASAVLVVACGQWLFASAAPQAAGALSAREREVLRLMAGGAMNREIAAVLHLSDETIKKHAAAVYRKLKVRNRTEAAQRGQALGLLAAALR